MKIKEVKPTINVDIWEMDSWSGRKHLETKGFKNITEAEKFINNYNYKNNEEVVPEYYTYAELK